jgi:hypothetical protein
MNVEDGNLVTLTDRPDVIGKIEGKPELGLIS